MAANETANEVMDVLAARDIRSWTLRPRAPAVKGNCVSILDLAELDTRAGVPHTESTVSFEVVTSRVVPCGGLDRGLVILLGILPR